MRRWRCHIFRDVPAGRAGPIISGADRRRTEPRGRRILIQQPMHCQAVINLHAAPMLLLLNIYSIWIQNEIPKKSNVKARVEIFLKYPCGADVWLIARLRQWLGMRSVHSLWNPQPHSTHQSTDNGAAELKNNHIEIQNSVYLCTMGFMVSCKLKY